MRFKQFSKKNEYLHKVIFVNYKLVEAWRHERCELKRFFVSFFGLAVVPIIEMGRWS